jgi:hypothetical protein
MTIERVMRKDGIYPVSSAVRESASILLVVFVVEVGLFAGGGCGASDRRRGVGWRSSRAILDLMIFFGKHLILVRLPLHTTHAAASNHCLAN